MPEIVSASTIKVKVTDQGSWRRRLEIEVPPERIAAQFAATYEQFKAKAKIPGFRPGKAPLDLVKERFAGLARQEVLEELVPQAYREAVAQTDLHPITEPEVKDVQFSNGQPLRFAAEFEIRPVAELKKYTGFKFSKPKYEITDADVTEFLTRQRERKAQLKPVARAAASGDVVVATIEKLSDRENRIPPFKKENAAIDLEQTRDLDDFAKEIVGMRVGEIKEFDVNYPADFSEQAYAGNRVRYWVLAKEVKEKILPPLDDEFAKQEGFTALADMREKVQQTLTAEMEREAESRLRAQVRHTVVEQNHFPVPQSLLATYLDGVAADFRKNYQNFDEKQVRESYRPLGEELIQWEILLRQIAEKENLAPTKEDTNAWLSRFAARYQITPEEAQETLAKSGKIKDVRETILEQKVIDHILKHSEVSETPVAKETASGTKQTGKEKTSKLIT